MILACIDIGGTTIKYAAVKVENARDLRSYQLLSFNALPTEACEGFERIKQNVAHAVSLVLNEYECDSIAVATAGTVDWDCGKVTYATDALPGFTGYELCKDLREKFGMDVKVINDATAAAVAEHFYNAQSGSDVVLTLGTGLGSALVKNAPLDCHCVEDLHLGHIILHEDGYLCKCGKRGCAEQYVSASALKRDSGQSDISLVFTDDKYAKAKNDFFDALHSVVKYACDNYSPDNVIIGGGVVEIKQLWWDEFLSLCNDCNAAVKPAVLANKAGVLGAAYSALCGKFSNQ